MVKADRSVTARLAERPRQDAVIGAILTMADALGVVFVAGAVESEAQLDELRELGCRYVQGNGVAPPMPASEVPSYLRRSPVLGRGGTPLQRASSGSSRVAAKSDEPRTTASGPYTRRDPG